MRLRTRILSALGLLLLFVLLPGPSRDDGPYLGYLQVRSWLLDARHSPLREWTTDGRVPRLAVDLRQSPPPRDAAPAAAVERLVQEWAAARTAAGSPTAVATDRPPLLLAVRIGTVGVQAELALPAGGTATLARPLPTRLSLLPAAIAIVVAVLTQRVLLALLLAGLAGSSAFVISQLTPTPLLAAPAPAVVHFVHSCLWQRALGEDFYLRITVFVLMLFSTVAITQANGGFRGLVALLQRRVRGPVGAQLCTFLTGCVLMFDDYTNCLVSGTAMRPLCDAMRVSRAKLAFLVDSTAAPIAGISLFSTWLAYETSQYRAPLTLVTRPDGTPYSGDDATTVFVQAMPYRFYCLFALALAVLVIVMRRDFGPMLRAERDARRAALSPKQRQGQTLPEDSAGPARPWLAIVPFGLLVVGTSTLLLLGWPNDQALLSASGSALLASTLGTRLCGALSWGAMALRALQSMRTLALPIVVLFLAWTLGHVTNDLGTSHYLTAAARGWLRPEVLPIVLFLLAGVIAFATGTSFGTMAILLPNVVLLAHELGRDGSFFGPAGSELLLLLGIAAVLEGAIFGDHCSPISDTTLLSSLSSGCDHVEHVVTQLPYALLAMAVTVLFGYLPIVLLGPGAWWFSMLGGLLTMAAWLRWFGRDPDTLSA